MVNIADQNTTCIITCFSYSKFWHQGDSINILLLRIVASRNQETSIFLADTGKLH